MRHLEGEAPDQAVTVFDQTMREVANIIERERQGKRLQDLPSLDTAARTLGAAVVQLVDETHTDLSVLRGRVCRQFSQEALMAALQTVERLTRPVEEVRPEELVKRYGYVRQCLPRVPTAAAFDATPAGQPVLQA